MRLYTQDNEPIDFCEDCFPSKERATLIYGYDIDYDADHPDYTEWDDYTCEECGKQLGNKDQ